MSSNIILPPKTIGIIGGGQLGRMLAMSARQMGYQIIVLDPKINCSTSQVSDQHIVSQFDNQEALKRLYDLCDVITYEFENVLGSALSPIIDKVPQGNFLLLFTQDRLTEKTIINESGFKTVKYQIVNHQDDLKKALTKIGLPALLKTRHGGYDGKGQQFISNNVEHIEVMGPSILEAFIPIQQEVSLIVTRSTQGEIKMFPIVDNVHQSQRLIESSVPTTLNQNMINEIQEIGKGLVESIQMIGTLTIEFFITKDNEILINECAPRVHNSGHLTIEACNVSQFEQHIRAICGLPLKETNLISNGLMVNLYGQDFEVSKRVLIEKPEVHYHLYGKKEMKINRKVGHITVTSSSVIDIESYRKYFQSLLNRGN